MYLVPVTIGISILNMKYEPSPELTELRCHGRFLQQLYRQNCLSPAMAVGTFVAES